MVKKGSIIKINFDPVMGHEQAGYRPALIISEDEFHQYTGLVIVCPISNTDNQFPLHIPLEETVATTGQVLCQHPKSLDIESRGYRIVEQVSEEYINKICDVVSACIKR